MKTKTLSVRMDAAIVDRVASFEKNTGVGRATLVRESVLAVLNFQEAHGFVSFPIEIIPKKFVKVKPGPGRANMDVGG